MSRASPLSSPDAVPDCIRRMRPGDRWVYFVGYLPRHRFQGNRLDKLADAFLRAGVPNGFCFCKEDIPIAGSGQGHLVQRKLAPFYYEYIFIKR